MVFFGSDNRQEPGERVWPIFQEWLKDLVTAAQVLAESTGLLESLCRGGECVFVGGGGGIRREAWEIEQCVDGIR